MKNLSCKDLFYEAGCIAAVRLSLRNLLIVNSKLKTLLRSLFYSGNHSQFYRNFFRLIYIFAFSCITFSSFAQKKIARDTSTVEVRSFSDSSLNAFKNNPDFQYEKFLEPPQSLWDRFWNWVWQKINSFLSTTAGAISFKVFLIAAALAAIIIFILKTSGMNSSGLFKRKSGANSEYEVGEENIHEMSFDIEINKAIASGNFRLAVRLLYLQTLKILSDRSFIHWDQNKTNYAYIKEMEGKIQQPMFAALTNAFEYTWYGNNSVSEESFKEIQNQFQQFKQL